MAWNIVDISKGFIRDTGYFLSYTYYIGKPLETSEYFSCLDLGIRISLEFVSGLGFSLPTLRGFLPGLGIRRTGCTGSWIWTLVWTFYPIHLRDFVCAWTWSLRTILGLRIRTGCPNIGQRTWLQGEPLPARWVRAPLLDRLSTRLVIYSSGELAKLTRLVESWEL
jgi:hypothetical protein